MARPLADSQTPPPNASIQPEVLDLEGGRTLWQFAWRRLRRDYVSLPDYPSPRP
jgi:hypothetical protein